MTTTTTTPPLHFSSMFYDVKWGVEIDLFAWIFKWIFQMCDKFSISSKWIIQFVSLHLPSTSRPILFSGNKNSVFVVTLKWPQDAQNTWGWWYHWWMCMCVSVCRVNKFNNKITYEYFHTPSQMNGFGARNPISNHSFSLDRWCALHTRPMRFAICIFTLECSTMPPMLLLLLAACCRCHTTHRQIPQHRTFAYRFSTYKQHFDDE